MPTYATDIDLLHWEPNIFTDAAAVAPTLMSGTGDLDGTRFTIAAGSLIDSHVSGGENVIVLNGSIIGSFPITNVNSSTELKLSVMYDDLEASETPVGTGSGIAFSIRTLRPQRAAASEQILQAAGLKPAEALMVTNDEALRRPCVLGTLQLIYIGLAAHDTDHAKEHLDRAALYERLYNRALRNTVIELDLNGDGKADTCRRLGVLSMRRG